MEVSESGTDPAAARFAALQLVRLGGALLVLFGLLVLSHRFEALAGLPDAAGFVIAAIGLADFFAVPKILARKWRTPKP